MEPERFFPVAALGQRLIGGAFNLLIHRHAIDRTDLTEIDRLPAPIESLDGLQAPAELFEIH